MDSDGVQTEAMPPFSIIKKVSYYGDRTQFDIRAGLFVLHKFHYSGEALITKNNASHRLSFVERTINEEGECKTLSTCCI